MAGAPKNERSPSSENRRALHKNKMLFKAIKMNCMFPEYCKESLIG